MTFEARMKLYYTRGSPFARIIRVLLRELDVACEDAPITEFPPPAEFFAVNPLGQVPALETEGGVRFPTKIILDHLLDLPEARHASSKGLALAPSGAWKDEQLLTVLLAMGDALVAMKQLGWAGLGPVGTNLLEYDLMARQMDRLRSTLDWLEARATPVGFRDEGLSTPDIVLSCLILWAEDRGGIPWRGRPKLEAIVSRCAVRPSFVATPPPKWPR